MPNWDRNCSGCGFVGSYLDFIDIPPKPDHEPPHQRCDRTPDCGETVEYKDDDADTCCDCFGDGECGCDCHDYEDEP